MSAPLAGVDAIQRRTLRLLFVIQIIGGVGVALGAAVGALLTAEMARISLSGLAQSATVMGAALFVIPATAIVRRSGRRLSLAAIYLVAALGAAVVVAAATAGIVPLLFLGFFLFGGAVTAGFQARYAALDLAPESLRGRHLSFIIWATTLGAVAGPNLAAVAGTSVAPWGVPTLAGPYVFSAGLFILAALLLALLLRPDPILVARQAGRGTHTGDDRIGGDRTGDERIGDERTRDDRTADDRTGEERPAGMGTALRGVLARPSARLGLIAVAIGHLVMVGVMAMTPVHIRGAGHDAAHTLRIVGIVISLHIAGMYAFAPLTGWLTDRVGRRPVILAGSVLLLTACALAGRAGHDSARLAVGLAVLGLGWSCTMVAGSTLLSESVPASLRPSAQGLSDLVMGLAAAAAGALSGVVVHHWGYGGLAMLAASAALPLIPLAGRRPGPGEARAALNVSGSGTGTFT
jgi:MFS family permease